MTDGARTRDIQDHNLTLYQLSYDHQDTSTLATKRPLPERVFEMPPSPAESDSEPPPSEDRIQINASLSVAASELTWRYSASGGPGGQHANTSNTKASVTFDIANSPSLTDVQRARLIERLGVEVTSTASDERSQLRNRNLALERLRTRLSEALTVLPPRRPTRPSKGSQLRRLDAKSRTATVKAGRRTRYQRDSD